LGQILGWFMGPFLFRGQKLAGAFCLPPLPFHKTVSWGMVHLIGFGGWQNAGGAKVGLAPRLPCSFFPLFFPFIYRFPPQSWSTSPLVLVSFSSMPSKRDVLQVIFLFFFWLGFFPFFPFTPKLGLSPLFFFFFPNGGDPILVIVGGLGFLVWREQGVNNPTGTLYANKTNGGGTRKQKNLSLVCFSFSLFVVFPTFPLERVN